MKISLYAHGGSANHGCEALVRSTVEVLGKEKNSFLLLSESPEEDFKYGLSKITQIKSTSDPVSKGLKGFIYKVKMKFLKVDRVYYHHIYRNFLKKQKGVELALAIGGDNYCYTGFLERFGVLNDIFFHKKIPTVLWGCSIDPHRINKEMIRDLKKYKFITSRESITYKALKQKGLSNVYLIPDTAFRLKSVAGVLPEGFDLSNTVGINLSPLLSDYEKNGGIVRANYTHLIEYILDYTELSIAFIPHVVWKHNDDSQVLKDLYNTYKGTKRVTLVTDQSAESLKWVISKCRFMIAARTHASIAAYSSQIPTLVVGYSVKAKGIATDLFGTDENYVLPVDHLTEKGELTSAFIWLMENENRILKHYSLFLEGYISRLDYIKQLPIIGSIFD